MNCTEDVSEPCCCINLDHSARVHNDEGLSGQYLQFYQNLLLHWSLNAGATNGPTFSICKCDMNFVRKTTLMLNKYEKITEFIRLGHTILHVIMLFLLSCRYCQCFPVRSATVIVVSSL